MKPATLRSLCLSLTVVAAAPAAIHAQAVTFAPPKEIVTGAPAKGFSSLLVSGNFNGDGNTSLIVNKNDPSSGSTVEYLSGDGAGNFTVVPSANVPYGQLAADVNGDGKDDVIQLIPGCEQNPCNNYPDQGDSHGIFTVLLSSGGGNFTPGFTTTLPAGLGVVEGVVGDFNNDGKRDVAVLAYESGTAFSAAGAELAVFINQGSGSFTQTDYSLPSELDTNPLPTNLVVGDFSGNGHKDLAFAFQSASGSPVNFPILYTLANDGLGNFGPAKTSYLFDSYILNNYSPVNSLQAGDLNGDGRTDLVTKLSDKGRGTPHSTRVPSLLSNSQRFFWSSALSLPVPFVDNILLADMNGDGKLDLIFVTSQQNSKISLGGVYLGLGNGRFQTPHTAFPVDQSYSNPYAVAVPLKTGALPSLIISSTLPTLELLVNTTK